MLVSALSALPCAVTCAGSVSFLYRETEKNAGLTGVPLPLCCFGALAQSNKFYLLTGADKSVYEKTKVKDTKVVIGPCVQTRVYMKRLGVYTV